MKPQRTLFAEKDGRWCEVGIELSVGDKPRLSLMGHVGVVVTVAQARQEAREYWESFFEEIPSDGEFHGLDVHHKDGGKVYLVESCGQIREEAGKFFPGLLPIWNRWHLNDMQSGSPVQEAALRSAGKDGDPLAPTEYPARCTWLAARGLNPDPSGYVYGSKWLYEPLPADVIAWARGEGPLPTNP